MSCSAQHQHVRPNDLLSFSTVGVLGAGIGQMPGSSSLDRARLYTWHQATPTLSLSHY